jgi:hypothetical protein
MDPYIDPDALDPTHPLTPRKRDNLARADAAHRERSVDVAANPSKVTFQTTDVCNLDCPHCQIPRAAKLAAMHPALLDTPPTSANRSPGRTSASSAPIWPPTACSSTSRPTAPS